jgi:hypothetical protein
MPIKPWWLQEAKHFLRAGVYLLFANRAIQTHSQALIKAVCYRDAILRGVKIREKGGRKRLSFT